MERRPIPVWYFAAPLILNTCVFKILSGISPPFGGLFPSQGQVAYALLTRPPVYSPTEVDFPLDLHVLGTPPAFVLSQDQTLHCLYYWSIFRLLWTRSWQERTSTSLFKERSRLSQARRIIYKHCFFDCKYIFCFFKNKQKKSGDDLLSRSNHRNSTISAGGLNCSVRDGKRCIPAAIVTRNYSVLKKL